METIPEKLLLFAILERAIADASGVTGDIWRKQRGEFESTVLKARRWLKLWTEFDFEKPFTFPWVCMHLDVCPYELRARIMVGQWSKTFKKSQFCCDSLRKAFLDKAPTVEDEFVYH